MSTEVGSKRWKQDWSNLPHDLMSRIVDGLELKDLHSLRGVCKNWRDVSSKALLEKIESFGCNSWFLIYDGASSKCSLIRDKYKISITIPELKGATCLASHLGWLLVFCGGNDPSMFFLCPFSGAKIDLPSCPFTELSGHAAAFSAPPTCQDCNVVVIRRCSNVELELHLISPSHHTWTKHNSFGGLQVELGAITTAVFQRGLFWFYDNFEGVVTFCVATKQVHRFRVKSYSYVTRKRTFLDRLRLHENTDSISTLGTLYSPHNGLVMGQSGDAATAIGSESCRHLKGFGIMPRYHTPTMDQRW